MLIDSIYISQPSRNTRYLNHREQPQTLTSTLHYFTTSLVVCAPKYSNTFIAVINDVWTRAFRITCHDQISLLRDYYLPPVHWHCAKETKSSEWADSERAALCLSMYIYCMQGSRSLRTKSLYQMYRDSLLFRQPMLQSIARVS